MDKNAAPKEHQLPDVWITATGHVATSAFKVRDAIAQRIPANQVRDIVSELENAVVNLKTMVNHLE